MKVYKFKCDSCGSKKCVKIDDGYKCEYCGSVQDVIIPPEPAVLPKEDSTDNGGQREEVRYELNGGTKSLILRLIICLFAGWIGVHKFFEGRIFLGLVYLCTGGLFGIGVVVDIIRYVVDLAHAIRSGGGDLW